MADKTTLSESSQALFCALADYVLLTSGKKGVSDLFNIDLYKSYEVFAKYWDSLYKTKSIESIFHSHVESPAISYKDIVKFLKENPDWFISSVLIAKKLIEDIDKVITNFKGIKKPKAAEIWFVRGDKPVMKNIEELFKKANETQKEFNKTKGAKKGAVFANLNKWSPADIYFASDLARDNIEEAVKNNSGKDKKGYSFADLNVLISDLIDGGQLLPLSLKKQTKQVVLQKVNFDRKQELDEIKKFSFNGTNNFKKYTPKSPQPRYLSIYLDKTDKKKTIIMRHDPSSNAFKAEFVVSGGEARGGSVSSSDVFYSLFALIDEQFASKFYSTLEKVKKEFNKKVKDMGENPGKSNKKLKEAYDNIREEYSALIVTNVLIPEIVSFLDKDKNRSDKFVRLMYQYVTSRTEESSKFVIAK